MRRQLLTGLRATVCLLVLLSGIYPLAVWGIGRVAFRHQADGSFVSAGGKVVGSALIGQSWNDSDGNPMPQYFQPRPSAAGDGYDPSASSASNLGPSNPKLIGLCNPVPVTDADGNPQLDA
ncbi:MAG: potassium-transporting ATPase KdpC subunit, partial [Acidimicrobiia bacterium]|nr:potassium-transporting ATPase KdpC subunit [Acidimicrobiia bacterium]